MKAGGKDEMKEGIKVSRDNGGETEVSGQTVAGIPSPSFIASRKG